MRAFARIALVVVILSLAIPPAAGQAAEFTFRVGVMNVAGHPGDLGAKLFAKNIEKASNGRIKVEVFPGGVLGTENEMWEAMKVGTVDLATIAPGNMERFVPEMSIMSLPFLFKDFDHLFRVVRGPIGDKLVDAAFKKGDNLIIGWFGGSVRNLITRGKVVEKLEDLNGFKMRVWASPVVIETWKSLGTVPVQVAYAEAYTALQTGLVDGAENEWSTFTLAKWVEPSKVVVLTEHIFSLRPLVMGGKQFRSLPKDMQDLVRKVGRETAVEANKMEMEYEDNARKEVETKYKLKLAPINRAPLIERTAGVRETFAKKVGMEQVVAEIGTLAR